VIAADAKIALANGDLAQAAAKWDQYFVKVPTPSADAFMWASTTARLRGDLGLALQRATKGSEAHPGDLRLAIQRAELLAALGRCAESAALFDALARAMPDSKELAGMAADVAARAKSGAMPDAGPEVRALQAAAEAKDWPKARSLAAEWVQRSKQSLQAVYAQAMLEFQAGDKKQAQALAKKGLELFPQNIDLARLEALTATDDPIERVQMVAERVITDPAKRAPELQRAYSVMRDEVAAKVTQAKVTNPPAVKGLEADLAKIDARLAELSKQVATQSPDDPAVIMSLFGDAVARRDFVAAQAQVAAAAKQKASPELEVVLRARLLDAQDKRAEAIALLEKARAQGRTESAISATLAALVESSGNEPGAYALWKEAFERRPNDTMIARGWARAQARAGQGRNALEMMRSTAAANPNDIATQSQAALFEALYGSKARALQLRMGMLRSAPGDRQNLADIYALLHQPAEADSVVDDNGRPRFEARDWAAVPADEQRRLLDDAARRNEQLSESIYEAAIKDAPVDLVVPVAKARVMREQGTPEKGTAALQDLVKRAEAAKQLNTGILLELAAHQLAIGDEAGLDATLARAAPLQDPVKREVDVATVEIEARRNHIDKAIAAQEKCLGEPPVLERLMRLADLQVVAKRYEDAERTIERIRTAAGAAPAAQLQRNIEMLAAGIATGRAEQLSVAGKRDEARKQVTVALDALSKAITLAPSDYLAPLRRVQLLSGVGRADGDAAMQAQAIAEADRLIARDAMLWPVVSARADLALGRNDIQAAIGFVEKFIQAQPSSEEGRGRLVDMFAQAGNLPRAIEVCRTGGDLSPQNPAWPERLGDLLAQSGDFAGAAKQYDRAYVLAPKRLPLLAKAVDARLSANQAADALWLLRTRNEQVSKSATLRAYAAVALSKIGRRDEAAVAARDALAAARTDPDAVTVTERTLQILRRMYRDGHVAELEALVSQGGQPAPIECIALSEEWGVSGPAGFDKALSWADKALAGGDKVPANLRAGALMARGNALFSKGDAQSAVDAFAEAAKLAPTNPGALNNAAYLLAKVKGDYPQAVDMARRAVELAPGQPDFLDTLGYVELKSGKVAEAEDFLTKSVAVSPTASGLAHLAQVRIAQGKPGDAQVLLERARVKASDDDTKKEIEEIAKSITPSK
jgi:Tfp pilus assembly protein PilF